MQLNFNPIFSFQIDYILGVLPAVRQPQLYDLCGSTLNLIFDLSVPYASAAIDPLLNVSAVGNQCPPLKALRSTTARGFSCNVGEVLNMDANQVPRCCKFYRFLFFIKVYFLNWMMSTFLCPPSALSCWNICRCESKILYPLPQGFLPGQRSPRKLLKMSSRNVHT